MQQITITIGRGQVGSPRLLSPEQWEEFKADVESLLGIEGAEVVVSSDGTGSWTDADGRTYSEQNHVWIAIEGVREHKGRRVPLGFDTGYLRTELARLATKHDQDAIALGFGASELVEAAA